MNSGAYVLQLVQATSQQLGAQRRWERVKNADGTDRTVRCRVEQADSRTVERWAHQDVTATHLFWFAQDPGLSELSSALELGGERYELRSIEDVARMGRLWEHATEKMRSQPQ